MPGLMFEAPVPQLCLLRTVLNLLQDTKGKPSIGAVRRKAPAPFPRLCRTVQTPYIGAIESTEAHELVFGRTVVMYF